MHLEGFTVFLSFVTLSYNTATSLLLAHLSVRSPEHKVLVGSKGVIVSKLHRNFPRVNLGSKTISSLNAPIATKFVCFSRLLFSSAPIVCSGSTLFASILNLSVMLGNYLQQTTSADAYFSWCFKG